MAEAKPTVYVETTIPSYLTAWPSSNLIVAGHQQLTRKWWENSRQAYDLYLSDVVIAEIRMGDPQAAQSRLDAVRDLLRLASDDQVRTLADEYAQVLQIPSAALPDAVHLALAVNNELDYLLTWNCKHLANPNVMRIVTLENTKRGLHVPLIVTPENLLDLEEKP